MTVNDIMPQRANRHGSKCPVWCAVDHTEVIGEKRKTVTDSHVSAPVSPDRLPWDVKVKACQHADRFGETAPQVELIRLGDIVLLGPADAPALANMLEALAGESPDRLRELAADLRTAAGMLGAR